MRLPVAGFRFSVLESPMTDHLFSPSVSRRRLGSLRAAGKGAGAPITIIDYQSLT
jgi:hypothetical protein